MAPEISIMTPCEWGQFVILDNVAPKNTYRNRLGYSYSPVLDAIDEDGFDGELMKPYSENKDYKECEEDCFGKDGSMKTFIIRCAGFIAATCITIIIVPMWYFQY